MDVYNRWFFMPGGAAPGTSLSKKEAETLNAKSTGIDLSYDVISADSWTASALLADRYGDRRIFIVGDAAHLHPPTGGYGMNMGIGDSVDLGRSEEHKSELQSLMRISYAVFCLKKKTKKSYIF